MASWSKLQSKLYELVDPKANFQIHVAVYANNSNDPRSRGEIPRYWITIDKDIVFDFPKMFEYRSGWAGQISDISDLIRDYIDCPKEQVLSKNFQDNWGITDILKLVDKRVGKEKFKQLSRFNKFIKMLDEEYMPQKTLDQIYNNRWGK